MLYLQYCDKLSVQAIICCKDWFSESQSQYKNKREIYSYFKNEIETFRIEYFSHSMNS